MLRLHQASGYIQSYGRQYISIRDNNEALFQHSMLRWQSLFWLKPKFLFKYWFKSWHLKNSNLGLNMFLWLTCLTKSRLIFKDTPSQDDVLNVLFNCFYQSVSLVLSISVVGYHFSLEVKIKIKKRTRVKNQLRLLSYLLN